MLFTNRLIGQWSGRPGFNPRSRHTKDLKKWYLIPPCLALSNISYVTRVKWSNPAKGVAPSPIPWCRSYLKWEPSGRSRPTTTTYKV